MSQEQYIIPTTLKVGYNKRRDTYTGKLAFVTYIDTKGVHRSERSWNTWRDAKINPDEFDNTPVSGLVLNKKAGDYSWGWHKRQAKIRVYDPRGFEIEITVENLLFILEETSSIKGKGLEGEFVYAWSGTQLLLIPTHSNIYQRSVSYTKLQTKKIGKKDMIPGRIYKNKDNDNVMYLGRLPEYEYSYTKPELEIKSKLMHVFAYTDEKLSHWWIQRGFTKLAEIVSEPDSTFANYYDKYIHSFKGTPPNKLELKDLTPNENAYEYRHESVFEKDDCFISFSFNKHCRFMDGYKILSKHPTDDYIYTEDVEQHIIDFDEPAELIAMAKQAGQGNSYYRNSMQISQEKYNECISNRQILFATNEHGTTKRLSQISYYY